MTHSGEGEKKQRVGKWVMREGKRKKEECKDETAGRWAAAETRDS